MTMTAHLTIVALALLVSTATAEPALPYPKTGQCAAGFRESGGYCAPDG
jgi:hypothetical protein